MRISTRLFLSPLPLCIALAANAQGSQVDCNNVSLAFSSWYVGPSFPVLTDTIHYVDPMLIAYPQAELILLDQSIITVVGSPPVQTLLQYPDYSTMDLSYDLQFVTTDFSDPTFVPALVHLFHVVSPGDSDVTCYMPLEIVLIGGTAGIDEYANTGVMMWPIPVVDELHFRSVAPLRSVEVIAADGRMMLRSAISGDETLIDPTPLPCGVFVAVITTDKGVVRRRFLKN